MSDAELKRGENFERLLVVPSWSSRSVTAELNAWHFRAWETLVALLQESVYTFLLENG